MRNSIFDPWWSLYPNDNDSFFNLPCWEALRGVRKMLEEMEKNGEKTEDMKLGDVYSLYTELYKKYVDGKEVESKEKEIVNGEVVKDIHTVKELPSEDKPKAVAEKCNESKSCSKTPASTEAKEAYYNAKRRYQSIKEEELRKEVEMKKITFQNESLEKEIAKLKIDNAKLQVENNELRKLKEKMTEMADIFHKL